MAYHLHMPPPMPKSRIKAIGKRLSEGRATDEDMAGFAGLRIQAARDTYTYAKGIKISKSIIQNPN
jgi:hypothetical protein